jgi:hypothetical protein
VSTTRSRKRLFLIVALVVIAVLALLYAARVAILFIDATEGDDVPPLSSIPLPTGSEVTQVSTGCGSGGCWTLVTVRPPDGTTPEDLKKELGTTPQSRLPGSFWDPRTISLTSKIEGPLLVIKADYFSAEYVP